MVALNYFIEQLILGPWTLSITKVEVNPRSIKGYRSRPSPSLSATVLFYMWIRVY